LILFYRNIATKEIRHEKQSIQGNKVTMHPFMVADSIYCNSKRINNKEMTSKEKDRNELLGELF
jgi:hypothetical protein